MKPIVVLPIHDPKGIVLPHLLQITPDLKILFDSAVVHLSPPTRLVYPEISSRLEADHFFHLFSFSEGAVGDQFKALYQKACDLSEPYWVLHLCFPDRLAYALMSEHRQEFMKDIQREYPIPMLFQRSSTAWSTHPRNYYEAEMQITDLGEQLFGRRLDFAWCHLVITSGQLAAILEQVHTPGLEMMAEMILALRECIHTEDVDWLAWEDPFILGREAGELKRDREQSLQEMQKRNQYAIPMLQVLENYSLSEEKRRHEAGI